MEVFLHSWDHYEVTRLTTDYLTIEWVCVKCNIKRDERIYVWDHLPTGEHDCAKAEAIYVDERMLR